MLSSNKSLLFLAGCRGLVGLISGGLDLIESQLILVVQREKVHETSVVKAE